MSSSPRLLSSIKDSFRGRPDLSTNESRKESRFGRLIDYPGIPFSVPIQPLPDTIKLATQFFKEFEYTETPLLCAPTDGRHPDIDVPSSGH